MLRRCTLPILFTAVCLVDAAPLVREGAYWVETLQGRVPVAAGGQVKIQVRGPVTLRGGATEGVQYTLKRRVRAASEAEARRLLGQLAFRTAQGRGQAFLAMTYPERPAATAELEVWSPSRLAKAWVETHAGDIQVYDIHGDVHAESGGGIIQMDRVTGNAIARTAGGDVRLGRIGGSVRSFTGGGKIEVDRTGGESWFETAGGEILVYESGGAVHASTAGGNIRIGKAASSVSARSSGGRIEVQEAGGIVVAGTYGGAIQVGGAQSVRLEATGGSIHLRGSSGALRAVSDVGSILAELASGARIQDSLLATGAGDITVFIPSNIPLTVKAQNDSGRSGRIVSDFREINIRQTMAEGTLNGGGPVLQLTSNGGTIYLRKAQ